MRVPPSGGSLEIGNRGRLVSHLFFDSLKVPPSGGSLEIGNIVLYNLYSKSIMSVPPSGGSLEIGNPAGTACQSRLLSMFPLRGDPWKLETHLSNVLRATLKSFVPPSGGSLEIGNAAKGRSLLEKAKRMFPLRGDPWKLETLFYLQDLE